MGHAANEAPLVIPHRLSTVVGTIYGLVDVLMIFRASRRCLHDHIADTIVVTV